MTQQPPADRERSHASGEGSWAEDGAPDTAGHTHGHTAGDGAK